MIFSSDVPHMGATGTSPSDHTNRCSRIYHYGISLSHIGSFVIFHVLVTTTLWFSRLLLSCFSETINHGQWWSSPLMPFILMCFWVAFTGACIIY